MFLGVSIQDTHQLFSNYYLDSLFKPQWERFGINMSSPEKKNGTDFNGKNPESHQKTENSACCVIV